jgi:hypothetical protein
MKFKPRYLPELSIREKTHGGKGPEDHGQTCFFGDFPKVTSLQPPGVFPEEQVLWLHLGSAFF